jgi:hypothetical protein
MKHVPVPKAAGVVVAAETDAAAVTEAADVGLFNDGSIIPVFVFPPAGLKRASILYPSAIASLIRLFVATRRDRAL